MDSNFAQRREGLPPSITEMKHFFQLYGKSKTSTPKGWNEPDNWVSLDDIPDNKPFGFSAKNTDILFIDFDHVFVDGKMIPKAEKAYNRIISMGETYAEKSISGEGFHLLADLGDYADNFYPITNDPNGIIPLIPREEYEALTEDEQKKAPKIELFYHTQGRCILFTGNNKRVIEMARNEEAAAIFRECLKMLDESHDQNDDTTPDKKKIDPVDDKTRAKIEGALNYIDPDNREIWIRVGMALHNIGMSFEVWDNWSKKSSKYNDGKDETTEKKWKGFSRSKSMWNAGTIFALAKEGGYMPNKQSGRYDIKLVSGRELQKATLPPIVYPVDGMIPEGYTVFSAPFKYGKSWFALELCLAVAEGSSFLGMNTQQGAAVYFALEDCDKFAQERLNIVLQGRESPKDFYYIYEKVPDLDDGFVEYMTLLHDKLPNLKVIVIDILAKIEYQEKKGESAYKRDYRTGSALKGWADKHQVSVIAVTHTTKHVYPDDVFMNTTGTNGVTGSADALLTIAKKNRTEKDGILAITGRRVREKYLQVHLSENCIWINDGEADPETMKVDKEKKEQEDLRNEYLKSDIRKAVIRIADQGTDENLRAREIIEEARKYDIYILETAKSVGLFLHKNQNRFTVEDNVRVQISDHGTGSKTYLFKKWNPATKETESVFNEK